MIKIENTEVVGLEHAIRGMRNPKNSWDRSDSFYCDEIDYCIGCKERRDDSYEECPLDYADKNICSENLILGKNDHKLMMDLAKGGPVHAKYRRMIVVYVDITAPLYWWKEFDTYKVGTVANSCSTMHKIHAKEFTIDDFSYEHLFLDKDFVHTFMCENETAMTLSMSSKDVMDQIITVLNCYRDLHNGTDDPDIKKLYWWQMIQLLPSSYNQKRTIMLNYEVLVGMYKWRKDHKLDEWRELCRWIESLPYSELITGVKENE